MYQQKFFISHCKFHLKNFQWCIFLIKHTYILKSEAVISIMLLLIKEKSEFFPNDLKILLDILNSNCSPEVYYQLLQIDLESLLIAQQICHSHFRPNKNGKVFTMKWNIIQSVSIPSPTTLSPWIQNLYICWELFWQSIKRV